MKLTYIVATIALIAASGCSRHSPSESPGGTTTGRADSARDGGVPGEPQPDSALVALGNEPFWNVRVTSHEILYRDPEHQEGYQFPPVDAIEEGGARIFRTRRDIPPGEPGPRNLELRIRPGTCSDGMSDRQYSMVALLHIGSDTRAGCAFTEPNTGRVRTSGR